MWGYQEEKAIIILGKHFVYTACDSAWTQPPKPALYGTIFISYIAQNLQLSALAKGRSVRGVLEGVSKPWFSSWTCSSARRKGSRKPTLCSLWESKMCSDSSARRKETELHAMNVFDQLWHFWNKVLTGFYYTNCVISKWLCHLVYLL